MTLLLPHSHGTPIVMSARGWTADSRRALAATLPLALSVLIATPAYPQSTLDVLRQRDRELEAIRSQQREAESGTV